jgi:hypothetical protein
MIVFMWTMIMSWTMVVSMIMAVLVFVRAMFVLMVMHTMRRFLWAVFVPVMMVVCTVIVPMWMVVSMVVIVLTMTMFMWTMIVSIWTMVVRTVAMFMWTMFVLMVVGTMTMFVRVVATCFSDSQRFRVERDGHQASILERSAHVRFAQTSFVSNKMKVFRDHLLGVSMAILRLDKICNE